jgi:PAS domain S-box-containing protein
MTQSIWSDRVKRARQALGLIAQEHSEALPPRDCEAMGDSVEDLLAAVEELQVFDEELRAQNEELIETRRAVEREHLRYRDLFDLAPDGYLVTTPEGAIEEANRAAATLLNVTEDLLEGKPLAVFVPEEERDAFRQQLQRLEVTDRLEWDLLLKPREKSPLNVAATVVVARRAPGNVTALKWLIRDVSLHRRVEEQLRQSQKMEAIGRLAGGVAHDFNNLLTVIVGHTDMLRQSRLPDTTLEHTEQIKLAAERAANLTYRLLAFSRTQTLQARIIDLNSLVVDTNRMLARTIGENIEVDLNLASDLRYVKADPTQIEQVVMNLAINARDAMPRGGRLTLTTANVILDTNHAHLDPGFRPGPYVMLSVADNGVGMDQATLAHIFEPFFTTKEMGRGTGLGLATVHGIIRQSEGYVTVTSVPDRGTSVYFYLPQAEGTLNVPAETLGEAEAPSGTETILFVEDEKALRDLFCSLLRECGYRVLNAGTGGEALRIAGTHKGTIDLIVTDVIMPGMSGPDMVKRIATLRPETKVLYMSGYTADVLAHYYEDPGGEMTLLEKPFTPGKLKRCIRDVLNDIPIKSIGVAR